MKNKNIEELKKCFIELDNIVPTIDKIGSGFEEPERTALALLLYFKNEKVLDQLSKIRKVIGCDLKQLLGENGYDEFIEKESDNVWKPPYNATKEELLKMLED